MVYIHVLKISYAWNSAAYTLISITDLVFVNCNRTGLARTSLLRISRVYYYRVQKLKEKVIIFIYYS